MLLFLMRDTDAYNTAKEDFYVVTGREQGAFIQDSKESGLYNSWASYFEPMDVTTLESQLEIELNRN